MEEHIIVFVNGQRVELYRGMKVKHALIALDQRLYEAVLEGETMVVDHRGFRLGLDGTLHAGARITTHPNSSP
ncbi:MAG TPA: hypothetical protein DEO88_18975 [Syntrophobacteraceae bacterium]|nr:hypothetical protein [Syntrophobacteraceae bacterium]